MTAAPSPQPLPLAEDARRFVDDGFLVVADLVDADTLAALVEDIERFERGEYRMRNVDGTPAGRDGTPLLAVHFPHWVSPVMRSLVVHPPIVDVVGRIAGAHLPFWDGRVKCMQSMLFVKAPGLPGQAWHQDERFIATRDRSLVGAWIAIDDATVDNGCLWVLPGSHRSGYLWPSRPHGRPDEFDVTGESYGFDDRDAVPVEVPAGSVVFFNGYLLHRSLRNRSTGSRRALVNHYCNAWSLLPWGTAPRDVSIYDIATLDHRMVVPIGDDPYADRGLTPEPHTVFVRPYGADAVWNPTEA